MFHWLWRLFGWDGGGDGSTPTSGADVCGTAGVRPRMTGRPGVRGC